MTKIEIFCTIDVQYINSSNRNIVPTFSIKDFKMNIPRDHISIKVTGYYFTDLADAFKSLFIG